MDGQKKNVSDKTTHNSPIAGDPTIKVLGDSSNKPALSVSPKKKPIKNTAKMLSVVLSALIIIILIGGIYGVYGWQHSKLTSVNTQISSLNHQISSLSTQNQSLKDNPTVTNHNIFPISQFDINITVPNDLADLEYAPNAQGTVINLSTTSLTDLDSNCKANPQSGSALGDMSKISGTYSDSKNTSLVKQFSTFYISYTLPVTPCSSDSMVNSLIQDLITDLRSSFSSVISTSN